MQGKSKQELWSSRLLEQKESGLNIRSWCALEGITEATFHYWRKRLSDVGTPSTQLIALPLPERGGDPVLELQTPHGYVIRLGNQAQVGWLGAVLAALR